MNPLDTIRQRLQKYEGLVVEDQGGVLTVKARDEHGFDVSCTVSGSETIISFAGWHESFSDPKDALSWFAFGLSEKCRLKVARRGRTDYRWTVEELREGQWQVRSETGLLLYPFWFRR